MINTLEKVLVTEKAEQLAEMILQSEIAEEYKKAYKKMNSHPVTESKIRRFTELKERYEEVQRFGKYHPDYKWVNKEIREAKREMDLDDRVAEFRRAEMDLQSLLDEISVMIGHSVSEHIKVPTGNPFFDNGSCSGGCGSGGGCSCSA
ncbi:regulatory iron-sulfur-containing complex subunit RicF [Bacillus carboniphilus]|uniref:Regulatory iron-sulfur-containing complex subunit RicF n=1 Tax=Bacillus carboniphilus TaxID=86663 RepID=A0ABN0WIG6_9BACI